LRIHRFLGAWIVGLTVMTAPLDLGKQLAVAADTMDYGPDAQALSELGLFQGTEQGFELERGSSRVEALVMLIRLLGREQEALAAADNASSHPFRDVPAWANPYVTYAYQHHLAQGIADDRFGSADPITAAQYFAFILRSLGYSDAAGDFNWDQSVQKAAEVGIQEADVYIANPSPLLRGQLAHISHQSLNAKLKGETRSLLQKLESEGAITHEVPSQAAPPESASSQEIIVPTQAYTANGSNGLYIPYEAVRRYFPQASYYTSYSYPISAALSEEQVDTIGLAMTLYSSLPSPVNKLEEVPLVLPQSSESFVEMKVIFDAQGAFLAYVKPYGGRSLQQEWVLETALPDLLQNLYQQAVELSQHADEFPSELFYPSSYKYDNFGFTYDENGVKYTYSGLPYTNPEDVIDERPIEYTEVPTYRLDLAQLPASARHFTKIRWLDMPVSTIEDMRQVLVWDRLSDLLLSLDHPDTSSFYTPYHQAEAFWMLAKTQTDRTGMIVLSLVDEQNRIVAYTSFSFEQLRSWVISTSP